MTNAAALLLLDRLAREFIAKHPADAARTLQDLDAADAAGALAHCRAAEAAAGHAPVGPDVACRLAQRLPAAAEAEVGAEHQMTQLEARSARAG